jgi:hypothetical protein
VTGERDLQKLLASVDPVLRPGSFVFAVVADESLPTLAENRRAGVGLAPWRACRPARGG